MILTGVYLSILIFCLQGQLPSVQGDFRLVDKWTNEIVFQTASDFVRTGCGTFTENSYLKKSDPLDACDVPSPPPTASSWASYIFGANQEYGDHPWILFAEEGGCDLKTKFRNAASAGYSGIIVGTDGRHEEILHPVPDEDDEEFVDVHLVHSLDIRVLSKQFDQKDNVLMEPPGRCRCKDEYKRTWLRSRYISLVIRTWRKTMDACWQCFLWTLLLFGKFAKAFKAVVPYCRDTFSSIAISLASIVISITVMMLISIQNNARKVYKYRQFQERKTSYNEPTSRSNSESQKESSSSTGTRPPPVFSPPPPPPRKLSTQELYYTVEQRHRLNLNIGLHEPLSKAKVNLAYRDMALKYHPDKNTHLDEESLARITEEFRSKKKSRDILLIYCKV